MDDSTVSHPHLKNTIKCVSLAIYYHIKNNANVIKEEKIKQDNKTNLIMVDERDADSSLEIFDERLHPLTVSNDLHFSLFIFISSFLFLHPCLSILVSILVSPPFSSVRG